MWTPSWRTLALQAGTAIGSGWAVLSFASSHSVDLYAIVDQINVVVRETSKLVALATPFVTGAIAVWLSRKAPTLTDLSKASDFKGAVVSPELAQAVPSNKVVASTAELPPAAQQASATPPPKPPDLPASA